jgi:hypothetical protein
VKRSRLSAALVALVLMLSWANAARATTPSAPSQGDEKVCSPDEGLTSFSEEISTVTTGSHPTASASFTVKEGCLVGVALASFDEILRPVDQDPPPVPGSDQIPLSGPGDHTLTVDLPVCTHFIAVFVAAVPTPDGNMPTAAALVQRLRAAARAVASHQNQTEPAQILLAGTQGDTECPTTTTSTTTTTTSPSSSTQPQATNSTQHTTTSVGGGQLPFTGSGSLPLLIAALVMVIGGAASVLAARVRGRRA